MESSPAKNQGDKRKRGHEFSQSLKEAFENSTNYTRRQEDERATMLLKTRILPAFKAETLMAQSSLFKGAPYRVARILIHAWAEIERKAHSMRVLSPWDCSELSTQTMILLEYAKFQNKNCAFWAELVRILFFLQKVLTHYI